MNESDRASAKIYQFPIRHRALRHERHQAEAKSANDRFWLGSGETVVDDNWYHDVAIQAALQEGKAPRDH